MSSSRSTILSMILAMALVVGLSAGVSEAQRDCTSRGCRRGKLCTARVDAGLGTYHDEGPTCGACVKPWWFYPLTCLCGRNGGAVGPKGPAVYCNPFKEYCQRESGVDFSSYSCAPLDLQNFRAGSPPIVVPGQK